MKPINETTCFAAAALATMFIFAADKKYQEIGPVRVEPDKAGAANYINQNDEFKVTITRTEEIATIKWDFPDANYRSVKMLRYIRPRPEPVLPAKIVISSTEYNFQYNDMLPDINADYWYWAQITLDSGTIIYQGPLKAEYDIQ
jgi:hypothetical protein